MERSFSVLVAHERPAIGQAIRRVLAAQGFRIEVASRGEDVAAALAARNFDGLVLDVAMPGPPVHELVELAKKPERPVGAVILVASVFRKTSYKRKPQQLYGADDYVEIHRLGDELPSKLWNLLKVDPSGIHGMMEAAPPEHDTISIGARRSSASSMPRTIFSPTTTPIEPPMKPYSIDATTASRPLIRPMPTITASFCPVDFCVAASRALYGLVSVKVSGSFDVRLGAISSHRSSSNRILRRSVLFSRKWCAHLPHTCRFLMRSLV